MIGVIRHRGPDEFGAWRNDRVFLGHARLQIIDPQGGGQPLACAEGRCHITYNGEIFNYIELTRQLADLGHVFRTQSDTEVVVRAYLEWGPRCVDHFNGQFAFALWDDRKQSLFLARDRFGICPLFVTVQGDTLLFASEIKSLKAYPGAVVELDAAAFAEVLTYWANPAPGTVFKNVYQLPPGHIATTGAAQRHRDNPGGLPACLDAVRYWSPSFLPAESDHRQLTAKERARMAGGLREKLENAVSIRLRADVPVGTYLSGGLDSSVVTALAARHHAGDLRAFGLGFADTDFDERSWQQMMSEHVSADLDTVVVGEADLAEGFGAVPWHAESPLPRSAPTPLLALSRHVHDNNFKVVLTGEGADEVLVGYNLFREVKVRHFWSRQPDSLRRPRLLTRLYPHTEKPPLDFLRRFYGKDLDKLDEPLSSHRPRWRNTSAAGFLCPEALESLAAAGVEQRIEDDLPAEFQSWSPISRAQYLEMTLFMSGYLLSSQGDRMLMANSVEGRFPFLDHELVEFAAGIPTAVKLQSLVEKAALKSAVKDLVPAAILDRPKYPFRAPGNKVFLTPAGEGLVTENLLEDGAGWDLWQRSKVTALVDKWRSDRLASARDDLSFLTVLSGRILQADFGQKFEQRVAVLALQPEQIMWRTD